MLYEVKTYDCVYMTPEEMGIILYFMGNYNKKILLNALFGDELFIMLAYKN